MQVLKSALITAVLLGVLMSLPAIAQISNFDSIVASGDVTAGDDLTAGDDVISTDDVTVGDDIVVTDDATIGGLYKLSKAVSVTVTPGSTITPVGSYQLLTSAANVGTSDITVLAAGTVVHLINVANTTITLTDTGTLKLSGNAALGQYDSLTIISDGTNWIEVSETNN